jgi:D-alanine-D-alanine ligase
VPVAKAVALGPESVWTAEELVAQVGLPCFVKPTESGSSIGVSRVDRVEDLAGAVAAAMAAERPGVVVEAQLVGREFTVGVIPDTDGRPRALPITEIRTDRPFFDFEAKYLGASEEITPADLPPDRAAALHALALRTYALTECRGMARVDIIDTAAGPHVIEVNTVPGFSPASIIPQQAAAAGISTTELITRVLASTLTP